jgi:biopolymer transport protein ExbB/TolQ
MLHLAVAILATLAGLLVAFYALLAALILAGLLADLASHFWHWLTHDRKHRP